MEPRPNPEELVCAWEDRPAPTPPGLAETFSAWYWDARKRMLTDALTHRRTTSCPARRAEPDTPRT